MKKTITLLLSGMLVTTNAMATEKAADLLGDGSIPQGNYMTGSVESLGYSQILGHLRISSGSTAAGNTNWQIYAPSAIYLDVDTSMAGFDSTPNYVTSLGGWGNHWAAMGASAIYNATPTGFRVYLQFPGVTPAAANAWGWHILWVAIGAK